MLLWCSFVFLQLLVELALGNADHAGCRGCSGVYGNGIACMYRDLQVNRLLEC